VSFESDLSSSEATSIMELFLLLIKIKSKSKVVKISSFGSFSFKKTPKRLGRNPKTKDSYIIPVLSKLNFKPSNKIKEKIN
jgi:nucleoid DNA-binding protein